MTHGAYKEALRMTGAEHKAPEDALARTGLKRDGWQRASEPLSFVLRRKWEEKREERRNKVELIWPCRYGKDSGDVSLDNGDWQKKTKFN